MVLVMQKMMITSERIGCVIIMRSSMESVKGNNPILVLVAGKGFLKMKLKLVLPKWELQLMNTKLHNI
ncbi:Uncharacterised protein [Streptococcus pneumoniae]|nr:Uncharacterised protein [Streptococcus pneumoniae]COA44317.1 Uncharacterised protein [Streptococcus pneumoniae]COF01856.1 Uncharacterised protein [Streptococcus pneumoniae]COF60845.1 Uncharacterised protein [Streptococcus pneumoniae]VKE12125.1 Uncharacterised protein [Streptococcus pneumoniae]